MPTLLKPPSGSQIAQNTNDCAPTGGRGHGFILRFEWTIQEPLAIFEYQIKVRGPHTQEYLFDRLVPGRSFVWNNCPSFISEQNLKGWTWRIRARDRQRLWGFWTPAAVFDFLPCRMDDGRRCNDGSR